MTVRAIKNFSGPLGSYTIGQEFELPAGVDWLAVGLVVAVEKPAPPESVASAKKRATK